MKVLKCYHCRSELILTETPQECSCESVLGCIDKNGNADYTGKAGVLFDLHLDELLKRPGFSKLLEEEDCVLYVKPVFSLGDDEIKETESVKEAVKTIVEEEIIKQEEKQIKPEIPSETSFGIAPLRQIQGNPFTEIPVVPKKFNFPV